MNNAESESDITTEKTATKPESKKSEILRLVKYTAISSSSSILEYILFFFLVQILGKTMNAKLADGISTAVCYMIATILCYILNKIFVFEAKSKSRKDLFLEGCKYFSVAIPKMLTTTFCVPLIISLLSIQNSALKTLTNVSVQMVLFVIGYILQKIWVFKKK